jgi:hypothetical protein
MMELGFLTPLYNLVKDFILWLARRQEMKSPLAILEARKKWKAEFERHLKRLQHAPTYGDAIIRDVSRIDSYPEIDDESKGISPWFKVEVKGLYHRGFEVFLRIESIKYLEAENGWRFANYDEPEAVNAAVVGKIPFELVKSVDWDGDGYYPFPHIYCEFTKKYKQPYEEVVFYIREGQGEYEYFREVARYDDVEKFSKKYPKPTQV